MSYLHGSTQVLAHQGGWDEILLVAGPLAVFAGALYLANHRANVKLAEREQAAAEPQAAAAHAGNQGEDSQG